MRKRTEREQDVEVLKRLEKKAPEVVEARVDFDALVGRILKKSKRQIKRSTKKFD
jgi:hypothetical protein